MYWLNASNEAEAIELLLAELLELVTPNVLPSFNIYNSIAVVKCE